MLTKDDFRDELQARFRRAEARRAREILVNAGELNRALGGHAGIDHRLPLCCSAMYEALGARDEEVAMPATGAGAELTFRYRLPR